MELKKVIPVTEDESMLPPTSAEAGEGGDAMGVDGEGDVKSEAADQVMAEATPTEAAPVVGGDEMQQD